MISLDALNYTLLDQLELSVAAQHNCTCRRPLGQEIYRCDLHVSLTIPIVLKRLLFEKRLLAEKEINQQNRVIFSESDWSWT